MSTSHDAVFFISTGRCATQFFAAKLRQHFADMARVEHEPVTIDYQSRKYFSEHHAGVVSALSPAIKEHLASINATLKTRHYIETGWPSYGALPSMIPQIDGLVRIVHLYRHPIRVAASLTTHRVYRRGDWTDALAITPFDRGRRQSGITPAAWSGMSEFEKCLIWWTEINAHALGMLDRHPPELTHSMKFEEVFSGDSRCELGKLLEFLGLPLREPFLGSGGDLTDKYQMRTREPIDFRRLELHPETLDLMRRFGYEMDPSLGSELDSRYLDALPLDGSAVSASLLSRIRRRFQSDR